MANKKITRKYYFTVEGETEQWYLEWLQAIINEEPSAVYKVSIDSQKKDPLKRAKSLTVTQKTVITHLMDYESDETVHTVRFATALDRMKKSQSLGKQIKYLLGYSNFTFELWMILHKTDCNSFFINRAQYLVSINRAYKEHFEDLKQYKHEDNFKRILRRIDLSDVGHAIERSKQIMWRNEENGYVLQSYKGFPYYRENPSLSIWQSAEAILKDCGLL